MTRKSAHFNKELIEALLNELIAIQSRNFLEWGLFTAAVVFAILYFLEPFNFGLYQGNKFLFALGYAFSAFVGVSLSSYIASLYFKVTSNIRLNIIILILLTSIIPILCSYAFSIIAYGMEINANNIGFVAKSTATFFVTLLAINLIVSYNSYLRGKVKQLMPVSDDFPKEDATIVFHDQNARGVDLSIQMSQFVYAESDHNNVIVHYIEDGKLTKSQVRNTLAQVVNDIKRDNIMQCHRSFLINIDNVLSATGNSNGYILNMRGNCHSASVSRTYAESFRQKFHPEN